MKIYKLLKVFLILAILSTSISACAPSADDFNDSVTIGDKGLEMEMPFSVLAKDSPRRIIFLSISNGWTLDESVSGNLSIFTTDNFAQLTDPSPQVPANGAILSYSDGFLPIKILFESVQSQDAQILIQGTLHQIGLSDQHISFNPYIWFRTDTTIKRQGDTTCNNTCNGDPGYLCVTENPSCLATPATTPLSYAALPANFCSNNLSIRIKDTGTGDIVNKIPYEDNLAQHANYNCPNTGNYWNNNEPTCAIEVSDLVGQDLGEGLYQCQGSNVIHNIYWRFEKP